MLVDVEDELPKEAVKSLFKPVKGGPRDANSACQASKSIVIVVSGSVVFTES